ncbi:MAG TPA: HIT family protein [Candidatus Saccharimonadales bacterium]|nr:HIT family protein [Candidatus Saccharimonadales bacterium]
MNKPCDACNFLKNPMPEIQILDTNYWSVGIDRKNHAYLGRAYVTLKVHKPTLGDLSQEEWEDFQSIVKKLEKAYKDAFGADPLNWGCFMNHAFRSEPFNPHVHWHIYPRYKTAQEIDDIKFDDSLYGNFYDNTAERLLSEETVSKIASELRQHLSTS